VEHQWLFSREDTHDGSDRGRHRRLGTERQCAGMGRLQGTPGRPAARPRQCLQPDSCARLLRLHARCPADRLVRRARRAAAGRRRRARRRGGSRPGLHPHRGQWRPRDPAGAGSRRRRRGRRRSSWAGRSRRSVGGVGQQPADGARDVPGHRGRRGRAAHDRTGRRRGGRLGVRRERATPRPGRGGRPGDLGAGGHGVHDPAPGVPDRRRARRTAPGGGGGRRGQDPHRGGGGGTDGRRFLYASGAGGRRGAARRGDPESRRGRTAHRGRRPRQGTGPPDPARVRSAGRCSPTPTDRSPWSTTRAAEAAGDR
jgi:hypothetical protein